MKVWVFVEGPADRIALDALWTGWCVRLRQVGWGIRVIPLDDKTRYLRKIGHRAAEKLANNSQNLVVGLPDLYPNAGYDPTPYKHANLVELKALQRRFVLDALVGVFKLSDPAAIAALERFFPSAFKHDLEVLLLAAVDQLRVVLATSDALGHWRHPVEDQNQMKPPKNVVEELFRTKRGRQYRDTVHSKAVLEKVTDIRGMLYNNSGQLECPEFQAMLSWLGTNTRIPSY